MTFKQNITTDLIIYFQLEKQMRAEGHWQICKSIDTSYHQFPNKLGISNLSNKSIKLCDTLKLCDKLHRDTFLHHLSHHIAYIKHKSTTHDIHFKKYTRIYKISSKSISGDIEK
jgi:hypothetical protein